MYRAETRESGGGKITHEVVELVRQAIIPALVFYILPPMLWPYIYHSHFHVFLFEWLLELQQNREISHAFQGTGGSEITAS